ncbi:MAG TPA: aminotransferase class I/II-fold pyridoxal phosphate-dependent enzyme [Thermoanaerobaculia bacterium]|nr:aminotransferase class I/II-fold pyridoxal phosphate-dependent enzyme [Thermoanaerobaculia bacterium]
MSLYPHVLEPGAGEMRRMVDLAMEQIVAHILSLPNQPAANTEGAVELARSLVEPLPERGEGYETLLHRLFDEWIPKSFNTAGPGYLAYIPGGGIFHSALADLIASAVNRYVGVFAAAPALAQLEANVIRWFNEIVGYPREAGGILTSGGSLANFSAIVAARRDRLPDEFLGGTIYAGDQVHHSVEKAAMLAGFPPQSIRRVGSDETLRVRPSEMREAIHRDRAGGRTPFLIVASAGTTNTGAIDDLETLADLAREENVWLHVDAAYGGFFMLTDRGRERMRGLGRADSITLDPHKGLFVPYGTGSLLVREGQTLRRAHSVSADYMPPMQDPAELVDFCELSPELSRNFRGLRVWLPIRMMGIAPFRDALDEKLDLAVLAAEELQKINGIEITAKPQLSTLAFHLVREGLDVEETNRLNRHLLDRINARKRVYLTSTMLGERFVIRISILSFRTHRDRIEMAIEDIRAAIDEV